MLLKPFNPAQLTRQACKNALFDASVADIQADVNREKALQQAPGHDGLMLAGNSETLFLPQPTPGKGTVLLFHGYTAGPWQYKELGEKFHDAGYNVIAPRMPGHGVVKRDGTPTGELLPNTRNKAQWDAFIDKTYDQAAALAGPVFAIGLSGGGNVALRMGERHPEISGVAAMAPYLGADLPAGAVFSLVDTLDRLTFGLFGRWVLDSIPYNENVEKEGDPTPHTQGTYGQAKVMRRVGRDVKELHCPVQIISTDGDLLSGVRRNKSNLRKCDDLQQGWFRFAKEEGVPHAMVSPHENPKPEAVAKVQEILFNFVDKGLTTNS